MGLLSVKCRPRLALGEGRPLRGCGSAQCRRRQLRKDAPTAGNHPDVMGSIPCLFRETAGLCQLQRQLWQQVAFTGSCTGLVTKASIFSGRHEPKSNAGQLSRQPRLSAGTACRGASTSVASPSGDVGESAAF